MPKSKNSLALTIEGAPVSVVPVSAVPPLSVSDYDDSPPTVRSEPSPTTAPQTRPEGSSVYLADEGTHVVSSVTTPSQTVYGSYEYWTALAKQAAFGGFTIRLSDGRRPASGFATGFMTRERALTVAAPLCYMPELTARILEGYRDMLVSHWAELSDVQCMSGWLDSEGNLQIEGTVVCDSEAAALGLGLMTGQSAVYNLATGESISLATAPTVGA